MIFYKDLKVNGNMKYILPEEIVDLYEAGMISQVSNEKEFIERILQNAETVYPVSFNTLEGVFGISFDFQKNASKRNAETELSDKVGAILQLFGDKINTISNYEIMRLLNSALTQSSVLSLSKIETNKLIGILNEDGQLSTETIKLTKDNKVEEKQK